MAGATQYVMLMCSLPTHPGDLFKARQTAISRIGLDQRLRLLVPEHAQDLALIEQVVHWNRLPMGLTDAEFMVRANEVFVQVRNEFVKKLVTFRLQQRGMLAALRRRNLGLPPPTRQDIWGCDAWLPQIQRNWQQPDFGLSGVVPWLAEADRLLRDGDNAGLQRLSMQVVWKQFRTVAGGHLFDFEAVVIYVLRWNMVDRWVNFDAEAAQKRFQKLVDEGLGAHKQALNWH
jgi:Protein of unknown function (DUF2764)